ncbi:MAG: FeS-binding protein [Planctomycetes bacterium]|jgi:ABC-type methionine transport system ATPase subunit|nr:FeS-binding protein [Planctomycetota bacterium]MCL4731542.1 FeS-binding protein [Planctomycetota bacterium]
MSTTLRRFTLSFPQKLIREPILHNLSVKFGLLFNISKANVSDDHGYLELSLEGDHESLERALKYLGDIGVTITEK